MKKILTLLVASTALTSVIGLPALSAVHASEGARHRPFTAIFEDAKQALPVILASNDDEEDDDEEEEDDDDEDDDDDDDGREGARNPAPAGTVAPPQNGLFGTGTPPQVKVN
jgi:phosphopantothenoylcysteine synthetase/decarboxylase